MRLSEANKISEPAIFCWGADAPGVDWVEAEHIITFTTKGGTRVQGGRVLEVDPLAQLPIRVEYQGPEGKRIERFHPDEFKTFTKENRQ